MLARAKVFAFACIDPRFRIALERFIEKKFNLQPTEYDIKTDAGGVKELCNSNHIAKWLMINAQLAHQKHGTRIFIVCNHIGCSYYEHTHGQMSREQEIKVHTQDLNTAASLLKSRLNDIAVLKYIVSFEDQPKPRYVFTQIA